MEFVKKAIKRHGGKYNYSLVNYKNNKTKVLIICPEHGKFEQIPYIHLSHGCPKCGNNSMRIKISLNHDEFVKKAIGKHGNKYDYTFVKYVNSYTKIKIICPIHGEFQQVPGSHLRGYGCSKCYVKRAVNTFIDHAVKKHDNKYDYSLAVYKKSSLKIKIICPIHGEFEQRPNDHLSGKGCPECAIVNSKTGIEEFIKRSILIHDNFYDYSLTNYIHSQSKVKIICPIHGEFHQTPYNHLQNKGCPKCGSSVVISKAHREIVDFINETKIINDREIIKPYELDIFIPKFNLAIEFNGVYYHSSNKNKQTFKHFNKSNICRDKNIRLIQIFEDEWFKKKEIVKSIINNEFKLNNIITASECYFDKLSHAMFNDFYDNNHINIYYKPTISESSICFGLIYKNEIICAVGFNKINNDTYECTEFCNRLNYNVVDGVDNILSKFVNYHKPKSISIIIDRRYDSSDQYLKCGFKLSELINPKCTYVNGIKRFFIERRNCRYLWDAGSLKLTLLN